jgi:hypothetical protein
MGVSPLRPLLARRSFQLKMSEKLVIDLRYALRRTGP